MDYIKIVEEAFSTGKANPIPSSRPVTPSPSLTGSRKATRTDFRNSEAQSSKSVELPLTPAPSRSERFQVE